ncbi:hypothetical protein N7495_001633 [Penicillium taxi]|uniref:uncharacterized protein n=1 Tax=Penicillium taxi TaxID=168475 RepID=UPI002545797F|nr:uncharacterized protein N7495_001633 [Penicillium taxi]KAJ5908951.1 hypothetical protein N7495_001633 [Penicillium taxi]
MSSSNPNPSIRRIPSTSSTEEILEIVYADGTKRLTNPVIFSRIFCDTLLERNQVCAIAEKDFKDEAKNYWMNTAQVLEISPINRLQPLHRDLKNNDPFIAVHL